MKKLVSRFMAVLMAMTMILSMSMTAFAAGEAQQGQAVDTASSNLFEAGTASTQQMQQMLQKEP